MNRSILFIASSVAALCVAWIWLVRKTRRGSGESAPEIGQHNEFSGERQPIPDGATEKAVQSGGTESVAAPGDPAGGRQHRASKLGRRSEDRSEAVPPRLWRRAW